MHEIMRTNDPVALSFARSLLEDAGIFCMVADESMSVLDGSLGILPRRLLIDRDEKDRAIRLLEDAGLGIELKR